MTRLSILAKCAKCGRGFVTVPAKLPAFDQFGPADRHYRAGDDIPVCGGRIELTHEGTKLMSTGSLHQDDKVTLPKLNRGQGRLSTPNRHRERDVIEVRTSYSFTGDFGFDSAAHQAAGRVSDFGGCGFGQRDLGWVCKSEIEAERIKRALDKIGLKSELRS